jgi:cytidylate kinase
MDIEKLQEIVVHYFVEMDTSMEVRSVMMEGRSIVMVVLQIVRLRLFMIASRLIV